MALPSEIVLENSKSWFHYFKEYNEAITMLGDNLNPSGKTERKNRRPKCQRAVETVYRGKRMLGCKH